jgi:hypothetical protein
MKKIPALIAAAFLLLVMMVPAMVAAAEPTPAPLPASALVSLTHNCPNTGKMLPETFSPYIQNYLLTVASWVSRVQFTPISMDPAATIMVNGQYLASGQTSQEIEMTNDPQTATISVTSPGGETTVYTVFLQRRPSEARTRVSVGYLKDFYKSGSKWYAKLDLVTVTYGDNYTNYTSAFSNDSTSVLKHEISKICIFYTGDQNSPHRYRDPTSFQSHVTLDGTEMFRVIYLEDEIVALIPYANH